MTNLVLKLTGDEAHNVRGALTRDGVQVFSVFDFMTNACENKDSGVSDLSELKKLAKQILKNTGQIYYYVKLSGKGQSDTPCMTIQGLLVLLQCLGDKLSKAFREQTFNILQQYLYGDTTVNEEITQNKSLGKQKRNKDFAEKGIKRAKVESSSHEMPAITYVYGTKSDAFPGLIKIGGSINPTTLNTGCTPAPNVLVAVAPTFNNVRDEALAHTFFSSERKEGEFFEVSQENVRAFFTNHITAQYQIELAQHIARVHETYL